MSNRYTTRHNSWDPNLVLPLVVSRFNEGEIYVDHIWGIKINRVAADNNPVAAEEYDVDLEDVNFNKMAIGQDPFVYQVRFNSFYFARTFTDNDFQLERYNIPQNAKQIRIEYRLRESDESLGPLMTLESYITD